MAANASTESSPAQESYTDTDPSFSDGSVADGVTIEPEAEKTHGISSETCARYGVAPIVAVSLFNQLCMQSDAIVAHNMSFDESIMKTALFRLGNKPDRMQGILAEVLRWLPEGALGRSSHHRRT